MSRKTKGIWGENPKYPSKPEGINKKPPSIKPKPVKSRRRHGRPIKNEDVSDGGGEGFIVFILILIFFIIVLALW